MSDPVLQLTGISKAYNRGQPGEVRVLNGVDLTVQPGEVVALVAPPACFQTFLLHHA